VEALKRKGLARGGSLDNAVVIGLDKIQQQGKNKLRWPTSSSGTRSWTSWGHVLAGQELQGKITAVKIGHGHNINFVKERSIKLR